jgi:hypothetical protein
MSSKSTPITRAALSKDIEVMRSMPQIKLSNLSRNEPSAPTTKGAVEALETVSINTSTPDEVQPLTKAYIKAMRTEVLGIDGGANEELGSRLDEIRGKAEGISEALSEVKV